MESGVTGGQRWQHMPLGVTLSTITFAQLAASFGIQWYTVTQLGARADTDALYAGFTFTQVLMVVLIDPLGFILTPMLSIMEPEERRTVGWWFMWFLCGLVTFLAALLWILTPLIVPLLVPGFSETTSQLTITLSRIQLGGAIGAACTIVLSGLYHAAHKFIWPAFVTLGCLLIGWGVLLVGLRDGGVILAAWVQVFCFLGPVAFLLPVVGWSPRPLPYDMARIARETWHRAKPLIVSTVYYRTGFVVDRFLSSLLPPGSLVILELVWRMHTAFIRIVNQGVATPAIPVLAALSEQGKWRVLRHYYRDRLHWIAGVSLTAVLGLMVSAVWVPSLFNATQGNALRGALGADDLHKFWLGLFAGSGILLVGGINHFLMNAFYAQGDTKTPVRLQIVAYTVGIILKIVGCLLGGLFGILLAISLSYLLETSLLGMALRRGMAAKLASEGVDIVQVSQVSASPPLQ